MYSCTTAGAAGAAAGAGRSVRASPTEVGGCRGGGGRNTVWGFILKAHTH